jgi:hypothetical protein
MENFTWAFESRLEKTKKWYTIAATIAITATIVSFLLSAYLLGIVVIIFTGVYLLYEVNSHWLVHVNVSREGVTLEGNFVPFWKIQTFSIIRINKDPYLLRLYTMTRTVGTIDIFLDPTIDTEALRIFLTEYVTEDASANLSLVDQILLGLRL